MRNLLRKPLPWMVVVECAIVAALAMVAWHMVTSPPTSQVFEGQAASPTAQGREPVAPGPSPIAVTTNAPVDLLLPGLNLNTRFWKQRLAELNRGESTFEQLEWRIVHAAMNAARDYVKSVVLPAIARAERVGR